MNNPHSTDDHVIEQKEKILGTWSLVEYTMRNEDSQEAYHPYGKNPNGLLIYTHQDVSVHIMHENRIIKDTPHEIKLEMAENYGGYVGNYKIQDDIIIHHPKISSFLNFIEIPQIRRFKLLGNKLILECDSINQENGQRIYSQLIWQKSES